MIRFHCGCGRPLKAPEKLAGKKSRCPSCAAAVVVPQLAVVFAGCDMPEEVAPEESFAVPAPSTWVVCSREPEDPNYEPTIVRTRGSGTRPDSLLGVKFVVYLSGLQALLTALGVALYPHVLHEGFSWMGGLVLALAWAGGMAVLTGYGCAYLDSFLDYAVSGGERSRCVPNRDAIPAIASFLKWALAFVLGPAVFLFLALWYWIHCGDVTIIDGLILAELTAPAIGYWIIGQLVLSERPELAFASPLHVVQTAGRLGRRALLATIGTTAAAFVYVCVAAYSVMLLHNAWLAGLLFLWLCWYSAWECGAFTLRIAGFWYYESRVGFNPRV